MTAHARNGSTRPILKQTERRLLNLMRGQPDFAQPLEMLLAGHDRIGARFDALRSLSAYVKENCCDERARQVAANLIRYFDNAARHRHDDVERELFPRLLRRSSSFAIIGLKGYSRRRQGIRP